MLIRPVCQLPSSCAHCPLGLLPFLFTFIHYLYGHSFLFCFCVWSVFIHCFKFHTCVHEVMHCFQIMCIRFSQWFVKRKGPFLWAWLHCDQYMVEPCFQIAYMSCTRWYICDWAFCPDFPYVLCNFALWSKCMIRMLLCLIMLYIYIDILIHIDMASEFSLCYHNDS